jgi:hypothetical protein
MRLIGQNSSFLDLMGTRKQNEVEKHRIWLNLFNNQGALSKY